MLIDRMFEVTPLFDNITGIAFIIYTLHSDYWLGILHAFVVMSAVAALHSIGIKFRSSIGRLQDKDLSKILVEIVFKGRFKALAAVLFVEFECLSACMRTEDTSAAKPYCAELMCPYSS